MQKIKIKNLSISHKCCMPQNISDLTEQREFGFAPLYIINANSLLYTIDNYTSEYIFKTSWQLLYYNILPS